MFGLNEVRFCLGCCVLVWGFGAFMLSRKLLIFGFVLDNRVFVNIVWNPSSKFGEHPVRLWGFNSFNIAVINSILFGGNKPFIIYLYKNLFSIIYCISALTYVAFERASGGILNSDAISPTISVSEQLIKVNHLTSRVSFCSRNFHEFVWRLLPHSPLTPAMYFALC